MCHGRGGAETARQCWAAPSPAVRGWLGRSGAILLEAGRGGAEAGPERGGAERSEETIFYFDSRVTKTTVLDVSSKTRT